MAFPGSLDAGGSDCIQKGPDPFLVSIVWFSKPFLSEELLAVKVFVVVV